MWGRTRARSPLRIAQSVAERLCDPGLIAQAVESARLASHEPHSVYWRSYGLAQGDAGLALMCSYFDACFPGRDWDIKAHTHIERAVSGMGNSHVPNGLHEGLSGLAFATLMLSQEGRRYRALLNHLHARVTEQARLDAEALDAAAFEHGLPFLAWDLIAGLAGVGAYLLTSREYAALKVVLKALIALTREQNGKANWRTPPEQGGKWMAEAFPDGHLNCGLAHGIPGVLALLSLSLIDGVRVAGQPTAVGRVANWLASCRSDDAWGPNWPAAIGLGASASAPLARAGWCYGSPGVARALWLAGVALERTDLKALAVETMRAVIRRPAEVRDLDSPALCHGIAGLLCVTMRFSHDTGSREFWSFARALMCELEARYEPGTLVGFRTIEPGGGRIEQAGWLDGAAGVAMTLLAAATDVPPRWDRLLLLS